MKYIFTFIFCASLCLGQWERGIVKREPGGDASVIVGDQTTEPIDNLFLRSVATFTLDADTTVSGESAGELVYTFEATTGHGLAASNEILLLDTTADREFYAIVTNVATDTITVDRPIDHIFPSATTLGREVSSNMAVDGSTTPVVFTARAGSTPWDITRLLIYMECNSSLDNSKFGNLTALGNGFVFRTFDGINKTIFNFKTNGDIAAFCYDSTIVPKSGGGNDSLQARVTFGGQSKHGTVLRIRGDDRLQWIVQDDLSTGGILKLQVILQGHKTEGEQ
jgi:hypothetical protein